MVNKHCNTYVLHLNLVFVNVFFCDYLLVNTLCDTPHSCMPLLFDYYISLFRWEMTNKIYYTMGISAVNLYLCFLSTVFNIDKLQAILAGNPAISLLVYGKSVNVK